MNQQQFAACVISGVLLCFSPTASAEPPVTHDIIQSASAKREAKPRPESAQADESTLARVKAKSADMPELPASTPVLGKRRLIAPDRLPDEQLGLGCAD